MAASLFNDAGMVAIDKVADTFGMSKLQLALREVSRHLLPCP